MGEIGRSSLQFQSHTSVGALEDRCGQSLMRAAARGSDELMSTGALISIECRLLSAWAVRWVMLSPVNECLFLAFFLPSGRRWMALAGLLLSGGVPGLEHEAPEEPGRPLAPGTGLGLSISISCLAVSFSCSGQRRQKDCSSAQGIQIKSCSSTSLALH